MPALPVLLHRLAAVVVVEITATAGRVASAVQPGNIVDLAVQFVNADTLAPYDPVAVSLVLTDPAGVVTTHRYPGTITRTGVGSFSFDLLSGIAGRWVAVFRGDTASTPDIAFTVLPSVFG